MSKVMSKYLRKNSQLVKTLTGSEDAKFHLSLFFDYIVKERSNNVLESKQRIDLQGIGDGNVEMFSDKLTNDLFAFHKVITDKEVYSSVWDETNGRFPNQKVYYYNTGFSYDGFIKEATLMLNESLENIFEDFKKI